MSEKKITPFEQALLDVTLEEFSDIPDKEDEIDVTFSPAFVAKSEKLIRNTQRKSWQYVNTSMKRVALIAIIATLLATTAFAFPAIREAIIRFFLHDEGTHYEFSFDPEQAATAPDCIETVYTPTYIPDGYYEDSKVVATSAVSINWFNDAGDWIAYDQLPIPKDPENRDWFGTNAEGITKQTLFLNGYNVLCIKDEGTSYMWTDNEYFYNLYCGPTVSDEEMQKIFYSIEIDEEAVIDGSE